LNRSPELAKETYDKLLTLYPGTYWANKIQGLNQPSAAPNQKSAAKNQPPDVTNQQPVDVNQPAGTAQNQPINEPIKEEKQK
jgi:hypothetical protein